MKIKAFLQNNLIVLFLINSGNIFAYLFQVVVGRSLSAEQYGSFGALNSLGILLSAPLIVIPLVIARYTAILTIHDRNQISPLIAYWTKLMSKASVIVLVLGIMLSPVINSYLHLDSIFPFLIILLQVCLTLILPIFLGLLQGMHKFVQFGIATSSVAGSRLLLGLLLVPTLGFGINGALLSSALGVLTALVISLYFTKDIFSLDGNHMPVNRQLVKDMSVYTLPVFFSNLMVMALGNIDLILVRHFSSPEETGLYAVAAILGRIAFYFPVVLVAVLFPTASRADAMNNNDSINLLISFGVTILLGGCVAGCFFVYPEQSLTLLFGSKYVDAAPMLRIIGVAMALLAAANILFSYNLARANYSFLAPLGGGLIVLLIAIYLNHESPVTIASILLATIVAILVLTIFLQPFNSRRTQRVNFKNR